ncbi:hypothetical protein ES705_06387 [subsurface metagenome]
MAHKEQIEFCQSIKKQYPDYFIKKNVLDAGSLDINGNNRYLFKGCQYTGIDLGPGKNVNIVCPMHEYNPGIHYDFIISTEMLEHDKYYHLSLMKIFDLVKSGGAIIITCATGFRQEHGTIEKYPESSPFTNDYYRNVQYDDISFYLPEGKFSKYLIQTSLVDLFFFGIKY